MSVVRSKRAVAAAAAGVAVLGTLAAVALGSPGSGFVGETPYVTANLASAVHVNHDGIRFDTKAPTAVRVQKFSIAPGGYSGWHHHPGMVIVAVASGAVTVWDEDCSSKTYGPGRPHGSVFVEADDHPGQVTNASATEPATVYATFVAPSTVFRIEDDPIRCP